MTDGGADEIVTFRLGPRDRAAIERLVKDGEFRNRSDFLRYAIKLALRDYEPSTAAAASVRTQPLDLELEDYRLPTAAPDARKRTARGRPQDVTRS